jgi:cell division protein FtsQ
VTDGLKPDPRTLVRRASRDQSGRWTAGGGAPPRWIPSARYAAWREAARAAAALGARVLRLAAIVAFLCGIASFSGSSVFEIQSIDVAGNEAVAAPEVVARSGLHPPMSVFGVNTVGVRDRLRADPRIADAAVAVVFPDQVRLTVQERPAAAALRIPDGYMLVTADGVALAPTSGPPALPVLAVDRLEPGAAQPGMVVPSSDVRLGADVAALLPPALRADIATIRVDRGGEVILYTRDGIAVKAGGTEGMRARVARTGDVLAAVRARGLRVEYVDLRFPDSVIVKPMPRESAAPGAPQAPKGAHRR